MSKVCWQFKVKERIRSKENSFKYESLDTSKVTIKRIDYKTAYEFIIKYEWLKSLGSSKYHFGLFIESILACVVCYADPVSPVSYSKILGINSSEILQLSRGANTYWSPNWVASKLIGYSLRELSYLFGIKVVVAYADPKAGEIGTIYQATNAYYIGLTNPGGAKYYTINGEVFHPRKVHKIYGSRKKDFLRLIDPNFKVKNIHPKHRYVFLLGSATQKKVLKNRMKPYIKSYPKRVEI